jgi:hypothetical protein
MSTSSEIVPKRFILNHNYPLSLPNNDVLAIPAYYLWFFYSFRVSFYILFIAFSFAAYQIEHVIFGGGSYEYIDLVVSNRRFIISSFGKIISMENEKIDERKLH